MQKLLENSLKKIAKGAFIIILGLFIGLILDFVTRIIIVRNLTQEEYGVLSLVIIIITLTFTFASLGLEAGIARFLAHYRAQKDMTKVSGTIISALELAVISSMILFGAIFFCAGLLAKIFDNAAIETPLRIYAVAIPFLVMITIFVSVYRGFERADIKVIFQEILLRIFLLAGLGIILVIGFTLLRTVYAYLAAAIITSLLLAMYSRKRFETFAKKYRPFSVRKTILFFSLPLLARTFLQKVMSWSDVLMIGYFKEEAIVGIYNAALPLAQYITIFLASTAFLYVPLATGLYSKQKYDAMKRNYIILTKWVFAATLPIFLILFLFPSTILGFLYGKEYMAASTVLSILALGFTLHSFLGPNGATLLVLGKTKFLMIASIFAVVVNIVLNATLIPYLGVNGAAIASASSLMMLNILISLKLYASTRIHPFNKNHIKPVFVTISLVLMICLIAKNLFEIKWWMLPVFFIFFVIVYCLSAILTKSLDKEDINLLVSIKKKVRKVI